MESMFRLSRRLMRSGDRVEGEDEGEDRRKGLIRLTRFLKTLL